MKHFFIAFLFISTSLFAQEQVLKLENITYSNFIKDETAFSLSNSETGELALIIPNKKTVTAYLFDGFFKRIDSISAESLRIKFKDIIGYRVTDRHYTTLFATENKSFLGIIDFNFDTGKTKTEQLDLNLSGETILETVTYNNRFFLLSVDTDFDGIILRELLENGTLLKKEIAIDGPLTLKDLLTLRNKAKDYGERKGTVFNEEIKAEIVEIDNLNPNSLETTSKLNKLYAKDNNLILTFDNFEAFTLAYFINLTDFSVTEKRFAQEMIDGQYLESSNSFLYKDYFFQLAVNDDKLIYTVSDFKTGENVKTYRAAKDRFINFKNTNLIQKNGFLMGEDSERILDDTAQFLRKINNGSAGIAIQNLNGVYQTTIGGTQERTSGGGGGMVIAGAALGGVVGAMAVTAMYNPTFGSYGSYSNTKSIYFESLFDANFNHIEGYPVENIFDKVKDYQESLKKIEAEEVFSHNGKVYLGYYEKKLKNYNIIEFSTEK